MKIIHFSQYVLFRRVIKQEISNYLYEVTTLSRIKYYEATSMIFYQTNVQLWIVKLLEYLGKAFVAEEMPYIKGRLQEACAIGAFGIYFSCSSLIGPNTNSCILSAPFSSPVTSDRRPVIFTSSVYHCCFPLDYVYIWQADSSPYLFSFIVWVLDIQIASPNLINFTKMHPKEMNEAFLRPTMADDIGFIYKNRKISEKLRCGIMSSEEKEITRKSRIWTNSQQNHLFRVWRMEA